MNVSLFVSVFVNAPADKTNTFNELVLSIHLFISITAKFDSSNDNHLKHTTFYTLQLKLFSIFDTIVSLKTSSPQNLDNFIQKSFCEHFSIKKHLQLFYICI